MKAWKLEVIAEADTFELALDGMEKSFSRLKENGQQDRFVSEFLRGADIQFSVLDRRAWEESMTHREIRWVRQMMAKDTPTS